MIEQRNSKKAKRGFVSCEGLRTSCHTYKLNTLRCHLPEPFRTRSNVNKKIRSRFYAKSGKQGGKLGKSGGFASLVTLAANAFRVYGANWWSITPQQAVRPVGLLYRKRTSSGGSFVWRVRYHLFMTSDSKAIP